MTTQKSPTPTARRNTRNVTAVLGPTNTGKTHLAIERMLGHESGLIGLPLRLLAREVYGRVCGRAGTDNVALVTGEEKIVPDNPRYWVATVEAMPADLDTAFVAIDEVQLAADLERGHIFTERLLNLRGQQETLLLGADTMRGIIEKLLPGIHVITRPRMSVLAYSGQKKLTRLPERSAIVTFSADDVYAVAELIRRQRGGAAVVLGALSPRTRNKQVEIYQAGDVDFLVATDAIGMGLNLDVDHVAFAGNRKFDGYQHRPLTAAELGQVAGRAGRHMRDGTFGVTGRAEPFPDPLVEALETHRFEPVKVLQWRNDDLDFTTLDALRDSLERPAGETGLTKAPPAADQVALEVLAADPDIRDRISGPSDVRTLWAVCRMPDYRKIAPAQHSQLVGKLFEFLTDHGAIPDDWIESEIRHANRTDGDIDTLSQRVSQVRTWTFVANQPDWVADPPAWQERSREAEDALSDALHEQLTQRFVDRRTSVLMRRLKENNMLEAEITPDGDVLVEGQHVGLLKALRFTADPQAAGAEAKTVRNAAMKVLASALSERADQLGRAGDDEILLSADAHLRWKGEIVGRLTAGDETLRPRVIVLADEQLAGAARETVARRLDAWIAGHMATVLKPLIDLAGDNALDGTARGLAFRLVENLGILDRRDVLADVRALDQTSRAGLRRHGVRFGAYHIFIPALLKPAPSGLLALLWALKQGDLEVSGLAEIPAISASGRTSVDIDPAFDQEVYRRFGYRIFGRRAVRIDILERLADLIRPALFWREPDVSRPAPREGGEQATGMADEKQPAPAADDADTPAPAVDGTDAPGRDGAADAAAAPDGGEPVRPDAEPEETSAAAPQAAEPQTAASPAASSQPDAPQRPDGAVPGGGFTVTTAMTSLLGASGEDFSIILKGLGYRVERRKLPETDPSEKPDPVAPGGDGPAPVAPETGPDRKSDVAAPPSAAAGPAPPEGSATDAPDTRDTPETTETGDGEMPPSQSGTAEDTQPAYLEVWRPARRARPQGEQRPAKTGDPRARGPARTRKRKAGQTAGKADRRRGPNRDGESRSDRPRSAKGRTKTDRIDPDSPFAALAELKKDLEKTER